MRRHAIIGTLLLIGLGVILGATVFRTDIAQATGLAQAVTVSNTTTNPVPVREQNLDGGNIKVHEQGTVNMVNTDVRTAVRYGPTSVQTFGGGTTQIVPTVPAGKTFVVTYFNISGASGIEPDQLVSGRCSLRLLTSGQDAPMGAVPLVLNIGEGSTLAGSEEAFLPLNSGEGLGALCSGKGQNGDFPSSFFNVNVGGYFIPA